MRMNYGELVFRSNVVKVIYRIDDEQETTRQETTQRDVIPPNPRPLSSLRPAPGPYPSVPKRAPIQAHPAIASSIGSDGPVPTASLLNDPRARRRSLCRSLLLLLRGIRKGSNIPRFPRRGTIPPATTRSNRRRSGDPPCEIGVSDEETRDAGDGSDIEYFCEGVFTRDE